MTLKRKLARAVATGAVLAGIAVAPATAIAQSEPIGPYDTLSPGNRKIARSLYEAQERSGTTTPKTLDEIAAMKQDGRGWGEVFKEMKADGLVQDKNLGQVVSQSRHAANASRGTVTTAGNRPVDRGYGRVARVDDTSKGRGHGDSVVRGGGHGGRSSGQTLTAKSSDHRSGGGVGHGGHGGGRGK